MTGVQTCALPICFPVTIRTHVGNISAEIQARVEAKTVDDSGFGFAYGSCKLLDMLGYGSFIGPANTLPESKSSASILRAR